MTKAAEVVLNDFRAAHLGRITLETPEEFGAWLAEGLAKEEALQKAREAKLLAKKGKRRAQPEDWEAPDATDEPDSNGG